MTSVLAVLVVLAAAWGLWRLLSGRRSVRQLARVRRAILDGAVVVDVRTPAEFTDGHIPGAINIPQHQLTLAEKCLREKSAPVVVYCNRGIRSVAAVRMLERLGFERVYDLGCASNVERLQLPFTGRRAPRCTISPR